MRCGLGELQGKPVINVRDGCRLGAVADLEFDTDTARVAALLVRRRLRLWGLLGRQEDLEIPWEDIQVLGEDAVLVKWDQAAREPRRKGRFSWFFAEE